MGGRCSGCRSGPSSHYDLPAASLTHPLRHLVAQLQVNLCKCDEFNRCWSPTLALQRCHAAVPIIATRNTASTAGSSCLLFGRTPPTCAGTARASSGDPAAPPQAIRWQVAVSTAVPCCAILQACHLISASASLCDLSLPMMADRAAAHTTSRSPIFEVMTVQDTGDHAAVP